LDQEGECEKVANDESTQNPFAANQECLIIKLEPSKVHTSQKEGDDKKTAVS